MYVCLSVTLHLGQTKPLMFSTTPMIGSFTFLQNRISFRTSCNDTSYREREAEIVVHKTREEKKEGDLMAEEREEAKTIFNWFQPSSFRYQYSHKNSC